MAKEDVKDASATPPLECVLEEGWDHVRFLVDGVERQAMPFEAYQALYSKVSASLALNQLPIDSGRGVVQFRLSPLEEVRKGRVVLSTEDGVTFGRNYKMTGMQPVGEGQSVAVIVDAATGEPVDRIPWPEMARRSKSGACRGATTYADMLGEFSGRLYFEAIGQIYVGRPKPQKEEEAAADAPPVETIGRLHAYRLWLRANPKAAYAIAAVGVLIVFISFWFFIHQPVRKPDAVNFGDPRSVDNYIASHLLIAECLRGVDLRDYARNQPQALSDSIHRLEVFLIRIERVKLSARQKDRVDTIRYELKHLQDAAK